MTSKLTREQLLERARENVKALKMASRQTAFKSAREEILADLQLAELALSAMDSEPVAYMTYKGYLLHAGDPKLAEYSEPTPLYADSRPAAMPAAPVAWLWSRDGDDERDVSLTPPDDDDDAADAIECGWTATPLYRHAKQSVVPDALADAFIAAIEKEQDRLHEEDYLMDSKDCIDVIREEVQRLNANRNTTLAASPQEVK